MNDRNSSPRMSRREMLRLVTGLAGTVALSACAAPIPPASPTAPSASVNATSAPAGFDWKKFAGTELFFSAQTIGYVTGIAGRLSEFEQLTGIKVTIDLPSSGEFFQKQLLALTTAPERVDLILYVPATYKWRYMRESIFEDLVPWFTKTNLLDPDYDFADLQDGPVTALSSADGKKLWSIPYVSGGVPFAYRKDLYEKKGLKVPTTVEEYESNIAACHDPDNELFGIVTRGLGYFPTHTFAYAMRAFGANYIDANGKAALNTPEFIQALNYYGSLLRKYGPPGAVELDDAKCKALYGQGNAAHICLPASNIRSVCEADQSKVSEVTGFFTAPKGPGGGQDTSEVIGVSMCKYSTKKEAAWLLLQWWTNKNNQLQNQLLGEPSARKSAWASPQVKAQVTGCMADFQGVLEKIAATGNPYAHPPAEDILAARTAVGSAITVAIQGGDVKAAADKANAGYQELLDAVGGVNLD